jgi:hypothetical protein
VLSIAESLTNIVLAPMEHGLKGVSLSANWMWPCKNEGEDARLYKAVAGAEKFALELGINITREFTRRFRPHRNASRNIFRYITADNVHQQHRHSRTHGTYCHEMRYQHRSKPGTHAVCRDTGSKPLLRIAILDTTQRTGQTGRTVHLLRLCQGRSATPDNTGHCDDTCTAIAVPVLKNTGIKKSARITRFQSKMSNFDSKYKRNEFSRSTEDKAAVRDYRQ